jgi:hypothetical protein
MLKECKFIHKKVNAVNVVIKQWEHFLTINNLTCFELEKSRIYGQRVWFLRLGPCSSCSTFKNALGHIKFKCRPPRFSLSPITMLKNELTQVASRISDGESDSNVVAGVRNSNEVAGI